MVQVCDLISSFCMLVILLRTSTHRPSMRKDGLPARGAAGRKERKDCDLVRPLCLDESTPIVTLLLKEVVSGYHFWLVVVERVYKK